MGFGSIAVADNQFPVSTNHNSPAIGRERDNLHCLVWKQGLLLSGTYVELDEIAARDLTPGKNLPALRARHRPTVNRRPLCQLHRRTASQYSQILHPNPVDSLKDEKPPIGCPTAGAALSPRLAIFKNAPQSGAVRGDLPQGKLLALEICDREPQPVSIRRESQPPRFTRRGKKARRCLRLRIHSPNVGALSAQNVTAVRCPNTIKRMHMQWHRRASVKRLDE